MFKRSSMRALFLAVLSFVSILAFGMLAANAAGRPTYQLFIYDPSGSRTVRAGVINHNKRFSASLVNPHTVLDTSVGLIYHVEGQPLQNFTCSVDLSNDTVPFVGDRAVWVVVGVDANGTKIKHSAPADFPASVVPGPLWTTFNYNAAQFSPPVGPTEKVSSFVLSLRGGNFDPVTHRDHWASIPKFNGVTIEAILFPTANLSNGSIPVFP